MAVVRHQVSKVIGGEDDEWAAEVIVSAVRTLLQVATDGARPLWSTLRLKTYEDELGLDVHAWLVRVSVDVVVPDSELGDGR
jgi:hypothetical protein